MIISIENQHNNETAQERDPGVKKSVGLAVIGTIGTLIRATHLDKRYKHFFFNFFNTYLTDRQNIKTCAVKCSYKKPLWPEGFNDDCMSGSEKTIF